MGFTLIFKVFNFDCFPTLVAMVMFFHTGSLARLPKCCDRHGDGRYTGSCHLVASKNEVKI